MCAPASELRVGESITRELRAGDVQKFTLHADAGHYIHVVLQQKGVDAAISLIAPNGAEVANSDRPNGRFGAEEVAHISTVRGEYGVSVSAVDAVGQGSYELTLDTVRPPLSKGSHTCFSVNGVCASASVAKQG